MSVWLLPENIADVLPAEARKLEKIRQNLLERFRTYGYELVIPPMLEYLESLLSNAGDDLELNTFKLVDQLSGKLMGVRADITPQVSRIDAHLLNRQGITRLCYAGSVLQTRPTGLHSTREPYQVGAEIFGYSGLEADAEVQQLAIDCLSIAGLEKIRLDLCHTNILEALLDVTPIARSRAYDLFAALGGKDVPRLVELSEGLPKEIAKALQSLPNLYGEVDILKHARAILPKLPLICRALNELEWLAEQVHGAQVLIDLADLRGYRYHTGVMFSIYVDSVFSALVRGGRYDSIGAKFGRARPATGFSLDLREVTKVSPIKICTRAISAPFGNDILLRRNITALRNSGEIVIQKLLNDLFTIDEFNCDRELVFHDGKWQVVAREI